MVIVSEMAVSYLGVYLHFQFMAVIYTLLRIFGSVDCGLSI